MGAGLPRTPGFTRGFAPAALRAAVGGRPPGLRRVDRTPPGACAMQSLRALGFLLTIGLLRLIELEPRAVFGLLVGIGFQRHRLGLPFQGGAEVAGLGVGGGEGVDQSGLFPAGDLARLGGRGDGLGPIAIAGDRTGRAEPGAAVEGIRVLGIELDGFVEVGDRLVVLLFPGVGQAAAAIGERVLGLELDDPAEIGDGLVEPLLLDPGVAAEGIELGALGIDANGLPEIGDGLVVFALIPPGESALDVGAGVVRIEADRLVEIGDRPGVLFLVPPTRPAPRTPGTPGDSS